MSSRELGAIAVDYDRTLTEPDGAEPTPDAIEALQAARVRGMRVIVVSGRTSDFLVDRVGHVADAIVAENGAVLLASPDAAPRDLREASEDLRRALATLDVPVERGRVVASFDAMHEPLVRDATRGLQAEIVRNRDRIMVLPPGVDKAVGLLAALEALGVDPSACVAFGDGENDAPMLKAAGLGVAVGNAVPELRASADEVAPGEGGHAVAEWLARRETATQTLPFASVVVPCRDEGRALQVCVDALLRQSYPADRYEIILVDGSSAPEGAPFGRALRADGDGRIRVLHDDGAGPSVARNAGIHAARGEIVAFTDADCRPAFDWLARLVDAFLDDPGAVGVAGGLRMPRETLVGRLEDADSSMNYAGYITSNVAYRRDALLDVGGFDEAIRCAEDYDLAWRMLDAGHRIARAPRAIVVHDPPEIRAPLRIYLRKQFWYARSDVATHVRALRAGRREAAPGFAHALADAACTSALVLAPLVGWRVGALAFATLGARSVTSIARTAHLAGESARDAPAMVAVDAAKRLVRGAGTLVGLAELALSRTAGAAPPVPGARGRSRAPSRAPPLRPRATPA